MKRRALLAVPAVAIALAVPAHTEPTPGGPQPDPNAPRCLTMGQHPFPHLQMLPCGWDFDGVNWIPPQDPPPAP